jgi:hypothetical protein
MHVDHAHGQDGVLKALGGLLDAFGQLDDRAMLATSGCFGWNVGDVLTHVHLGLQEMLLALGMYTASRRTRMPRTTGGPFRPTTA